MQKEQRISVKADGSWRFCVDRENLGLQLQWYKHGIPDFHDIKLPHTFSIDAGTQEYRGAAWYEYHFNPDPSWQGKQIYIQFNGVYRDADIWMNGNVIGRHYNSGFTTFQIDTKDTVKMNDRNILTLRVDNTYSDKSVPIDNSFDWADDGGIFRPVTFIVVNPGSVDYVRLIPQPVITDYGTRIRESEATLSGRVYLHSNHGSSDNLLHYYGPAVKQEYQYKIYEGIKVCNKLVYQSEFNTFHEYNFFDLKPVRLDKVKLWHFDEPTLYTIVIDLLKEGKVYDSYDVTFGFREFINHNEKYYLNGEAVRLVGSEWMPGSNPTFGNAEPEEYLIKILTQLKESNCVFTRFHWQQDDAIYEWCDQNGMLVQEEIPNWGGREQTEWHLQVSKDQADEMLRFHGNHPSIISWGIANELRGQEENTKKLLREFKSYFKTIDPYRLANYITCTMWENPSGDATAIGDSLWVNDYIGTWHGDLNNEEQLNHIVSAHPNKPLIMSEFGLCEPAFPGGDKRRIEIMKDKMKLYRKFPQIAGIIYFCLNDYRTQMGEEGYGALKRRVHGSTDIFGEPKPSYYEIQKQCAPVHLIKADEYTIILQASNDLPSYEINDYYLQITVKVKKGNTNYKIPRLLPGESCVINIQIPSENIEKIKIYRPTGYLVGEYIM